MSKTTYVYPLCPAVRKLRALAKEKSQHLIAKEAKINQPSIHSYLALTARPGERNMRRLEKAGFCSRGDWGAE